MIPLSLDPLFGSAGLSQPAPGKKRSPNMNKTGKIKASTGAAKARAAAGKATRNRQSAETKLV